MAIVTGDRYLEQLLRFVERNAGALLEGLLARAPVDYLRAYISDLGDHRALEQLRRILALLTSLKVVSVLPPPARDPTTIYLLPFGRLKVLELRGCDLSTSSVRGLLELRHTLEKLICYNSTKRWGDKVYIDNSYYLHGFWTGLVDKYEEMMEKYHPGLGDERWPFITHFVGCKPCGSYGDYPVERCLKSLERAFNFADNQVLRMYGFYHGNLTTSKIKRTMKQTEKPLEVLDQFNPEARIETKG